MWPITVLNYKSPTFCLSSYYSSKVFPPPVGGFFFIFPSPLYAKHIILITSRWIFSLCWILHQWDLIGSLHCIHDTHFKIMPITERHFWYRATQKSAQSPVECVYACLPAGSSCTSSWGLSSAQAPCRSASSGRRCRRRRRHRHRLRLRRFPPIRRSSSPFLETAAAGEDAAGAAASPWRPLRPWTSSCGDGGGARPPRPRGARGCTSCLRCTSSFKSVYTLVFARLVHKTHTHKHAGAFVVTAENVQVSHTHPGVRALHFCVSH